MAVGEATSRGADLEGQRLDEGADEAEPDEARIFIFTAANPSAKQNLEISLRQGIELAKVQPLAEYEELERHARDGRVFAWGARPGKAGERNWADLRPNDIALVYSDGRFLLSALLYAKAHSTEVARSIWGEDAEGKTFEYMVFLDSVEEIDASLERITEALGYSRAYTPQGLTIPGDSVQRRIRNTYGSVKAFVDNLRSPALAAAPRVDLEAVSLDFSEKLTESHLSFGAGHDRLVRSFVAAMATKSFVILTGLSGSGKTQLALSLGRWFGVKRLLVTPVRPDWTGAEALFGYEDALQATVGGQRPWHVPGPLEFMLKAAKDPGNPYLLVLDEMNLAHVERYFADVLSGMESREDCLPNLERDDEGGWHVVISGPEKIKVPRNLFVAGTVNVDETTYMFSPKVLDRANTFEFRVLTDDLSHSARRPADVKAGEPALVRGFLEIAIDDNWHHKNPSPVANAIDTQLRTLHRLLSDGGFEFGHRVFYEAMRFSSLLAQAGEPSADVALDHLVLQKVLPRMHGSRRRLEPSLHALGSFCIKLRYEAGTLNEISKTFDPTASPSDVPRLPLSFDKIQRMARTLHANQFASFTD